MLESVDVSRGPVITEPGITEPVITEKEPDPPSAGNTRSAVETGGCCDSVS